MKSGSKDILIGRKLRQLRNMRSVSQGSLADDSGITFQQIQKYEKGINRISASRLYDFSKILDVDVKTFFEPIIANEANTSKGFGFSEGDSSEFEKEDVFSSKETVNLVREYYKITDVDKRKHVLEVIKAMSGNS